VCAAAAADSLPVYLYGATAGTLDRLRARLLSRVPGLRIAGWEPSKFRPLTEAEKREAVARIRASGAAIVFVGLGCPRQEVFVYEYRDDLSLPVVAVGAAFPYHAGELCEPGPRIQRLGLQWLHRLGQDPRRLWKRYLVFNPLYLALLGAQAVGMWRPRPDDVRPPEREVRHG
jgi:exopolysaccharide biosynthesis WecB/TagA/CpsF family protein